MLQNVKKTPKKGNKNFPDNSIFVFIFKKSQFEIFSKRNPI